MQTYIRQDLETLGESRTIRFHSTSSFRLRLSCHISLDMSELRLEYRDVVSYQFHAVSETG